MSLRTLLQLTDNDINGIQFESDSGENVFIYRPDSFDLIPEGFLYFAKKDVQQNDERGIVNSISNSKRAIDCQFDRICHSIGIERNWQFPKKREFIEKIVIIAK